MHLVGDRFSLPRNILASFTAGSNEVFFFSRRGIWAYEREAMRKGIDLWRDPAEYWIAADEDPTAYRPSQRMDSTYFPRGP